MLERLRPERQWQWAAYGKHPAAKDYFTLGQGFPLLVSFSGWIENGYQVLVSKEKPSGSRCSWRFWTREARRDNVVCGIICESTDGLARPYPLLIIGTGPLKDWSAQWDLVPLACDAAWTHMENVSTRTFGDLRELEEEVRSLRVPVGDWLELARKRERFREPESFGATMAALAEGTEYFFPMAQIPLRERTEAVSLYHSLMRSRVETAPNATFMGGSTEKPYMAFFRRPLSQADFIRLWSMAFTKKDPTS